MILTVTLNPCLDETLFLREGREGDIRRPEEMTVAAGGKGNNVARAIRRYGGAVESVVTLAGHTGRRIHDLIAGSDEVTCHPIWVEGESRTIWTIVEKQASTQTVFFEDGPPIQANSMEELLPIWPELVSKAEIVAICGSLPPETSSEIIVDLIRSVKESDRKVFLDSSGEALKAGIQAVPTCARINVEEGRSLFGPAENPTVDYAQKLRSEGIEQVIVSDGERGAVFLFGDEGYFAAPPSVNSVNPVGSGDAMTALVLIGLTETWPLEKIIRNAVAAGASNAMKWKACDFEPDEVDRLSPAVTIQSLTNGRIPA